MTSKELLEAALEDLDHAENGSIESAEEKEQIEFFLKTAQIKALISIAQRLESIREEIGLRG